MERKCCCRGKLEQSSQVQVQKDQPQTIAIAIVALVHTHTLGRAYNKKDTLLGVLGGGGVHGQARGQRRSSGRG